MRRQDDGSGCGARGRRKTHPPSPGGDGAPLAGTKTCRQELADGRGWSTFRKRGPYAVQRHRRGAPRGALRFWSRFVGAPRPRHWRAEESAGERPAHPGPFKQHGRFSMPVSMTGRTEKGRPSPVHSRESGNPAPTHSWVPAFAGTNGERGQRGNAIPTFELTFSACY